MRASLFLMGLVFSFSCNNNGTTGDVIPKDKMAAVLQDMLLADAFSNNYIIKDSSLDVKKENARLYEEVFALHETTRGQFQKSYQYYSARPVLLQEIFDTVNNRLKNQRFENFSKPVPGIRVDSLKVVE